MEANFTCVDPGTEPGLDPGARAGRARRIAGACHPPGFGDDNKLLGAEPRRFGTVERARPVECRGTAEGWSVAGRACKVE